MPQKQHLGYEGNSLFQLLSIDTEPNFFFNFESGADGTFKTVGLFHLKKKKNKRDKPKITHDHEFWAWLNDCLFEKAFKSCQF